MAGPIRPDEVIGKKTTLIPEQVFVVFNDLIAKNWNGTSAIVKQDDVIGLLVSSIDGPSRQQIFDEHMLDVEDSYRAQGWEVAYDKPGYNETYPATFKFTRPSKH